MTVYLNRRARYSKGTLKLHAPLKLPEGAEVRVTVTPLEAARKPRSARPKYKSPTRTISWDALKAISGIVSLGGDAVVDSEALYDGA